MKPSVYILDELKEISPFLASMERKNIFFLPKNYFINLDSEILDKISTEGLLHLATSDSHTLKVPEGYFENLAGNILKKIKNSEIAKEEEISSSLVSLKKENVFKIPDGYFNTLSATILNKAKLQQQAKVVVMKKKSHIWQYAAAAMMTGVIALSSLWISNKSNQQISPVVATATPVTVVPSYIQESYKYKNEQQLNDGIAKLSDDDIIKYLETSGEDLDNKDLATSVSEKDLPDQEDYLLDEKTLDLYLNQLDSKQSN